MSQRWPRSMNNPAFHIPCRWWISCLLSVAFIGGSMLALGQEPPPSSIVEPEEETLPPAAIEATPEATPTPPPSAPIEKETPPPVKKTKKKSAKKKKKKDTKDTPKKPSRIRPGTKYMFVTFDIGPTFVITDDKIGLKVAQEFGYHINGTGEGLAIGVSIQEAFAANFIQVALGAKAWYNLPLIEDIGFYLTPSIRLGYGFDRATEYVDKGVDYFNIQISVEARLVLDDLWLLYIRPVALDVNIGEEFTMSYDAVLGFGYTF